MIKFTISIYSEQLTFSILKFKLIFFCDQNSPKNHHMGYKDDRDETIVCDLFNTPRAFIVIIYWFFFCFFVKDLKTVFFFSE